MTDVSVTTGETFYSGSWENIKLLLRVLNIGEGKMAQVTQTMVNQYQEMIDRDIDALFADVYHVPIRSYNMVQPISTATPAVPGGSVSGVVSITNGSASVTVSGAGWAFTPTTVVAVVLKPAGGFNIYATIDESTITSDGFTAILSGSVPAAGYSLSYIATADEIPGSSVAGAGVTVRVFPGDVRRAAMYWTAGQLLISEFQQLESNITEQATQMVSDARDQIFAMTRPNHRVAGQRRKSTISRTMPGGLQPNTLLEKR